MWLTIFASYIGDTIQISNFCGREELRTIGTVNELGVLKLDQEISLKANILQTRIESSIQESIIQVFIVGNEPVCE